MVMSQNKLQINVVNHLKLIYEDGQVDNHTDLANELISLMGLVDKEIIELSLIHI